MILLSNIFDYAPRGQLILGLKRSNYDIKFPCKFDLFNGEKKVATIVANSVALDNNYLVMTIKGIVDREFNRITLCIDARIDKTLIEGRYDA